MPIRTYTATMIIPAGSSAGTVQFGAMPANAYQTSNTTQGVPCNGRLYGVMLQFGAGTMVGGTATISTADNVGPAQTLLNYVGGTSNWFYPRARSQDVNGTNIAGSLYDQYPVDSPVQLVVSGGTAGTVTAKMLMYQ